MSPFAITQIVTTVTLASPHQVLCLRRFINYANAKSDEFFEFLDVTIILNDFIRNGAPRPTLVAP